MKNILTFSLFILLTSCSSQCNNGNTTPPPPPPPPVEKVMMRCNEPFITFEIRSDLNQITVRALDPVTGDDMVDYVYPYAPPTTNGGYKEHLVGGWYDATHYSSFYVRYKTASPANSCMDDMSGESFPLTGNIVFDGNVSNACGENL